MANRRSFPCSSFNHFCWSFVWHSGPVGFVRPRRCVSMGCRWAVGSSTECSSLVGTEHKKRLRAYGVPCLLSRGGWDRLMCWRCLTTPANCTRATGCGLQRGAAWNGGAGTASKKRTRDLRRLLGKRRVASQSDEIFTQIQSEIRENAQLKRLKGLQKTRGKNQSRRDWTDCCEDIYNTGGWCWSYRVLTQCDDRKHSAQDLGEVELGLLTFDLAKTIWQGCLDHQTAPASLAG
ncbi:hypothetical protein QBC37DRAFT_108645 [Rhypophila decipiens]|uniref:Uncharacterized protein n=1 Tax=Rhypophila decipiens TaxID=261697 RepID=A0AAN6YHV0_9PEZI|nr:hypothetical protein QBC37DRAFT_108645 [Rhypophila decipiens]